MNKKLIYLLTLLPILTSAHGGVADGDNYMMMDGNMMGWFGSWITPWFWLMAFGHIIFLIIGIELIIWLWKKINNE